MTKSAFLQPSEFYQRDINPIRHYVEQSAQFLSTMTGDPIEKCMEFVANSFKTKAFPKANDPVIHYFERDDNLDRHEQRSSLSTYIRTTVTEGWILAPTGTAYLTAAQRPSVLTEFVVNNKKRRNTAKSAAFVAKTNGNKDLYVMKNNEQANMKLYNNSLSGTFGTKSSVLCNPTGHNTLTSTIRCVSSFGNASNERVVAGNRHFWSKDVVVNNIIAVISGGGLDKLEKVMGKYNLHYPSVHDMMECITYSTDLYWRDTVKITEVARLVNRLSPIQRAAFVYNGDLYHLRKHNDQFTRNFLGELSKKVVTVMDDALTAVGKMDGEIMNFAHQICYDEVKGKGKRYEEIHSDGNLGTLVATAMNITNVIDKFSDFIGAIFLTANIPSSTAYIPNIIRRSVVLSDTDSTMFSVDDYAQWYFGEIKFNAETFALAGAVVFIASQTVAHSLAILSANINVARDKLYTLAMKPEYTFPVFALTTVAKHYYTAKTIQEGNVLAGKEMEIKGVHLINSSSPPTIISRAKATMEGIIDTITRGEKVSIIKYLTYCADLEREIIASLLAGETTYYRQSKIKEPKAYTKEVELSPYLHHMFWEDVMEVKYGAMAPPPYSVIKIPTKLTNQTAIRKWLISIEDRELAERLSKWLIRHNKTAFPTIYLSSPYVQSYGIPVEFKAVLDTKRITLDLMNSFRLVSESLGFFLKSGTTFIEMGY